MNYCFTACPASDASSELVYIIPPEYSPTLPETNRTHNRVGRTRALGVGDVVCSLAMGPLRALSRVAVL